MVLGWGTRIFHQWSTHWYTSSEIANFTEPFATPSISCPVFMKKMHKTFVQNQSETERYEMWGLVTTLQLRRETSEDNPREKYSCLITSLALLSHHFIAWFCTSLVGSHNHRYYFYCNSVSFPLLGDCNKENMLHGDYFGGCLKLYSLIFYFLICNKTI